MDLWRSSKKNLDGECRNHLNHNLNRNNYHWLAVVHPLIQIVILRRIHHLIPVDLGERSIENISIRKIVIIKNIIKDEMFIK